MPVFRNYTRTNQRRCADAAVHRPKTVAELQGLFDADPARTFTLRSAGQSFDAQALPPSDDGDVILFTELRKDPGAELQFRAAGVDAEGRMVDSVSGQLVTQATLEANAWATWGEIIDELAAHHHIPYSSVTGRRLSVAGSINADGLSQRSPIWGKEASTIVWIRYYHPGEGAWLQIYHPESWEHRRAQDLPPGVRFATDPAGHPNATHNHRLFHGLTGGLGVLGPIVRAKYLVLKVPGWNPQNPQLYTETRVSFDLTLATPVSKFMHATNTLPTLTTSQRQLPATLPPDFETYAGIIVLGTRLAASSGSVLRLKLKPGPAEAERPFLLWNRDRASETYKIFLGEHREARLMEGIADVVLGLTLSLGETETTGIFGKPYRNAWCPYTFFFEAHSKARDHFETKQQQMSCFQQSFSVPMPKIVGAFDGSRLLQLLRRAREIADDHGVRSTATDLVYLPPCDGVLSPSQGQPTIAVTFGLEWAADPERRSRIEGFLSDVSHMVAKDFQGRVHLGKNVVMRDADLGLMYGAAISKMIELAHEHGDRLTSGLWERLRRLAEAPPGDPAQSAAREPAPPTTALPPFVGGSEGYTPTDLDEDGSSADDCR